MSFCNRSYSLNSFSQAFHQTPSDPQTSSTIKSSFPIIGDHDSGEGPVAILDDIGLMSCTESLGFESSDEISTFDYDRSHSRCSSSNRSINEEEEEDEDVDDDDGYLSTSSSSTCSVYCYENNKSRVKRWRSSRRTVAEKRCFPPPLTSLSENGRRNFMLRPTRKDGRLEIVGVRVETPEILFASRCNGRLTLSFVKSVPENQEFEEEIGEERENEEFVEEENTGEEREIEEIVEETGVERENEEFVEGEKTGEERGIEEIVEETGEERENVEIEKFVEETGEERENEEEEREWKIPAPAPAPAPAGMRRCYHRHELHVWGRQQRRCVTTM